MTKTTILAIIAVSSASMFLGMFAYAVVGNTTVENIGVNPDTGFIQIESSDPDGLKHFNACPNNPVAKCFFIISTCDGPLTTSATLELKTTQFPVTVTVIDCGTFGDRDPIFDETVWKITSGGQVICTGGSCLSGPPINPGVPPGVPPGPP